ncbi:MBL fold metallo-hydrolase [Cytophagales bacterium LB-30]|uniref:MBL fold metallo-hydrolase n=1 Tax=Shiella aurantiaca TaxID=3058365 RepID=A0ABT8F7L1_9BACT|nr:MBL fold metallo-hydrolase [Shiella aurantiaca]MDN4166471.1 MBL fold metallo-hydrolase [Shiella aurantiaca]
MDVRIKFLGGAQTVTGSKYLLDIGTTRVLVDCGLFQGLKELRLRNWSGLDFDPASIDMVIITHAHIDHTGYLPKLCKDGFNGPIYCTHPTADLIEILLRDSAKLQEEEAEWAQKKGYSKHANPQALYTVEDAEVVFPLLQSVDCNKTISLTENISVSFHTAGHILGAAIVQLFIKGEHQSKTMVFSGDLGRYENEIMYDPSAITQADILLVESTYGNRKNIQPDTLAAMEKEINEGLEAGGCIVIPSFAVGRTQNVLFYLYELFESGLIPKVPVYIDSPMAVSVTNLYERYSEYHKLGDVRAKNGDPIFDYKQFKYVTSINESKYINTVKEKAIIISASGMCTGGRILHHLYHRLPHPQDTVLIVGYQAEGSRGQRILSGESPIPIFGESVPLQARIREITGLSAHADREELIQWLDQFTDAPKRTFIVHGEKESSAALAQYLKEEKGWQAHLPFYLESYELFRGI